MKDLLMGMGIMIYIDDREEIARDHLEKSRI